MLLTLFHGCRSVSESAVTEDQQSASVGAKVEMPKVSWGGE